MLLSESVPIKDFITSIDIKGKTIMHKLCAYPMTDLIFTISKVAMDKGIKFEKDNSGMFPTDIYDSNNIHNILSNLDRYE